MDQTTAAGGDSISQFLANLQTRWALKLSGCRDTRHVIEEHGIYNWKKRRHRWLDRTFNAKADAVIACSHAVARSATTHLKIPIDKIDVLHNCVDPCFLDDQAALVSADDKQQLRNQTLRQAGLGDANCTQLTGCVATLRWEKGHRVLLAAWEQLTKRGLVSNGHYLLLVGDGPLKLELQAQAAALKNVVFLGEVDSVRSVLKALDLFVLPSINEGFGIAIAEAMAMRVPVVTTTSGGLAEVVGQECGVMLAPGDAAALAGAIAAIWSGNVNTEPLVVAAREKVERMCTPQVYVDRLLSVYRRIGVEL